MSKLTMPAVEDALPGREAKMPVPARHFVNGAPLEGPFPAGLEEAMFAMGCFWGAERKFWQMPGVYTTAVGYAEASQLLGLTGVQTTTWAGLPVDATTLLLRYTYYGDLNLDGRVDADDFALLDRGFSKHLTGWVNGDVNYDGTVDAADYLLTDRSYALNGNPLTPGFLAAREAQFGPAYIAALEHAVPEPSAIALLTVATVAHMRRRPR